jgi:dihydroorotase
MELLLKNGKLVDHTGERIADIWIRDGKIAEVGKDLVRPGRIADLAGRVVMPGLVDLHVHLREPGQERKETIATGTAAAAMGGFTTICAMPNTTPPIDTPLMVELVKVKVKTEGLVEVLPTGAITKGQGGKEIAEMGLMHKAGAVAFTDDGTWVQDSGIMYNAMRYGAQWDLMMISHPEDASINAGGVMNAGPLADKLGLKGTPVIVEIAAVERDITLSEATGCRLHLTHLSTAGAVEAVRRAKVRGIRVTADVTPHHLLITEAACDGYNTLAKVNPPLRRQEDCEALLQGLLDGTIDAIATDHAPHKDDEKMTAFDDAPPGIIGMETAWALLYAHLVQSGRMPLETLVAKLTTGPRRVLGREDLTLSVGQRADITVIDPESRGLVNPEEFLSKGRNTPMSGWEMAGLPVMTIVGGRVVMLNGKVGEGPAVETVAQVG